MFVPSLSWYNAPFVVQHGIAKDAFSHLQDVLTVDSKAQADPCIHQRLCSSFPYIYSLYIFIIPSLSW